MGGLLGGGKSKSWSESYNKAYPWAMESFGEGAANSYGGATNVLGNILGLNGGEAGKEALDNYWNSSGGQFQLNQGLDAVNNKFASMGLSRSGSAMKAMENYRSDLASTKLDNYLGQLNNLGRLGLGGGGLVVDAGQVSKSKSKGGGGGLGGLIGAGASLASLFSDAKLKHSIEPLAHSIGGVPAYSYEYRQDMGVDLPKGRFVGVLAQDVARLRPDALGPVRQGFLTVNYERLSA